MIDGVDGVREMLFALPPPDEGPVYLSADTELEKAMAARVLRDAGWDVDDQDPTVQQVDDARLPESCKSVTWRPNCFLENVVLMDLLPGGRLPERGVAIDFGCGSGRDAVFLAQALPPSWRVIAIDNHKGALDRARRLAEMSGVELETRCIDLRSQTNDSLHEWAGKIDIAHGARFMEKNTLADLRDRLLRRPGGIVIWSTFVGAAQHQKETNLAPPFRHSRRWEAGEAARLFAPPQFQILHDLTGEMQTRRVLNPAAYFAARCLY